jgi:hypothetical protein
MVANASISELRKWRQEDHEFKTSLNCIEKPSLKTKQSKTKIFQEI